MNHSNVFVLFFDKAFSKYEEQLRQDVVLYQLKPRQELAFRLHYTMELLSEVKQAHRTSNVIVVINDDLEPKQEKLISYYGFGMILNAQYLDYAFKLYLDEVLLTKIPKDTSLQVQKIEKLIQKYELAFQEKKFAKEKLSIA